MKISCRLKSILFVSYINPECDQWNGALSLQVGRGVWSLFSSFREFFLSTVGEMQLDAELPQHHSPH